ESGGEVVLASLPGQIEGVDGNTVSSEAGTGIEGMKTKGLGGRGLDHLPDVGIHPIAEDLHLVDERNVDTPVDVFEELGHLGHARTRDGDDVLDHTAIQCNGNVTARFRVSTHELGNVPRAVDGVVRVFALRGIREMEVLA